MENENSRSSWLVVSFLIENIKELYPILLEYLKYDSVFVASMCSLFVNSAMNMVMFSAKIKGLESEFLSIFKFKHFLLQFQSAWI
jgi:hypothetical protein